MSLEDGGSRVRMRRKGCFSTLKTGYELSEIGVISESGVEKKKPTNLILRQSLKVNRHVGRLAKRVPVCPLCNAPVPSKRSDPPDLAVSLHIDNDCQADRAKSRRKVFTNKCTSKGCKIKEIVAVKCGDCGKNFCLKHRHPCDHACVGKEETVRQRRIEALNKQAESRVPQNNQNANSSLFRNLQGTISEDEALARALQASLQDEENAGRIESCQEEEIPLGNKGRCMLS
ncbi:AN1-type zinc finger protein 2B-like [Neodiprion fabricii]|uniref:AN1-type zinc finger protein 2B-like n=1 Tax=Neodiprion fabricii TaxID=2872261 RepID=UPI001ED93AE6|nr:AN1-type zinc finger protein 2B-like [Neodiprion fabricii]